MTIEDLLAPETAATRAARAVLKRYSSPALVNHCERSYLWSAALGELTGVVPAEFTAAFQDQARRKPGCAAAAAVEAGLADRIAANPLDA